jgi:ATP-dependent 26S proteasome regulatory subunit
VFLSQGDVEVLAHKSVKEAYSSVGGLNKQIEAIRDLLEIPLTRPELFRYFGKISSLLRISDMIFGP